MNNIKSPCVAICRVKNGTCIVTGKQEIIKNAEQRKQEFENT